MLKKKNTEQALHTAPVKKPLTFKKQIILSMVSVSAILLLLLGSTMYRISRQALERNYKETHAYNMELFSSSIHLRFQEITEASRNLLENSSFVETMKSDPGVTYYFSSGGQRKLEKVINEIEDSNSNIQGALVVNARGQFRYLTKRSAKANIMNSFYNSGKLLTQEWIKVADDAKGKEVFYGYDVLDPKDQDMLSMVKRLNQPLTGDLIGYLVVNIQKDVIDKTFGTKTDSFEGNRYLILDTDPERCIVPGLAQVVYNNITNNTLSDVLKAYHGKGGQEKYLFTTYHDSMSGWDIISVIDRKELSRQSDYIKWVMTLGVLILIAVSLPVANFMTRRLNRPLELLEETITQVGQGNYKVTAKFDNSEIGMVGQHFVDMAAHNLELRDRLLNSEIKEREAELLLLQSQINPHFLYNTLDALYFMAVIDKADDIAEMVKNLSDIFKLSLNKGDKTITVHSELEKIEAYMKIQNFRYHNRFEFDLDIAEDTLQEKILTFILQPLVENAVTHGLENKIGNGLISMIGYMENEFLHFTLHDNGVGISDMSLLDSGYGVRNIRERLRLFYGEEADVVFESSPGEGTTVFLKIPRIDQKRARE